MNCVPLATSFSRSWLYMVSSRPWEPSGRMVIVWLPPQTSLLLNVCHSVENFVPYLFSDVTTAANLVKEANILPIAIWGNIFVLVGSVDVRFCLIWTFFKTHFYWQNSTTKFYFTIVSLQYEQTIVDFPKPDLN